jgi:hypothetical protein
MHCPLEVTSAVRVKRAGEDAAEKCSWHGEPVLETTRIPHLKPIKCLNDGSTHLY